MSNLYNDIPEQMKGKTLMITGGTGSFGSTVLNRFLTSDIGEIRIFSRDEKKQDDLRHDLQVRFPDHADKVQFYIGDVRDIQSVRDAMHGVDSSFMQQLLSRFLPVSSSRLRL